LGDGFRVNNGWQLTNVFVAANATMRARGFVVGGRGNGSSWFVESIYTPAPRIVMNDGHLGFRTNRFGFNLIGGAGSTVVVDASSNMLNWIPIVTNTFPCSSLYFNDPTSTNFSQKFYRARLQR
jgi:hypothetical protein